MPREATIQRQIILHLRSMGAWVFNVHGSPYQQVGVPDLLVSYQGRFYGLEVKKPSGVLSPVQAKIIEEIRASGAVAGRVENIEEAVMLISQEGNYSCGRECGKNFATASRRDRHEANACKFRLRSGIHRRKVR